ncbi:MAG: chorismate synthase [Bacteroidales bacterium]|jgi:chorismate synthase|nr:chorismate synthase [Bacteroidales bacterium]
MSGNTFGNYFRLTSFGESHGPFVGGVIEGCPSNMDIDFELINNAIKARKTAMFPYASQRKENDELQFISGIIGSKTTGTPIAFIIKNQEKSSTAYEKNKDILKPSHGYFTYWKKYGIYDYTGSGRASARETIVRVIGGCFAMMYLQQYHITIKAYTTQIGKIQTDIKNIFSNEPIITNPLHCPDNDSYLKMLEALETAKNNKDTIGAKVSCVIKNTPIGLGEPVFDKLHADLGKAMLSINAAKGFEIGSGFTSVCMYGSEHNDLFTQNFHTKSNHSGGIQAGISNGEVIYFSVAFKPISSLMKNQESIDIKGNPAIYTAGGKHDFCVVPRVIPIVEAMAALVIADHILRFNAYKK